MASYLSSLVLKVIFSEQSMIERRMLNQSALGKHRSKDIKFVKNSDSRFLRNVVTYSLIMYSILFTSTSVYAQETIENLSEGNSNLLNEMAKSINATNRAAIASQITTDALNKTIKELQISRPAVVTNSSEVSPNQVVNLIFDNSLPAIFIIVIFLVLVIPMIFDMYLAYRKRASDIKDKTNRRVQGMPGLYRTLMTFGIILLVGTIIFYILALITVNLNSPVLEPLIGILRDLSIILGTGLATIIAFYFGIRGSETSVEKAAAAITSRMGSDTVLPTIVNTSPIDGAENVPINSLVQVTFSETMNGATINQNTLTVKKEDDKSIVSGTLTLSPEAKTVSFDADEDFWPKTKYTATVTTGVQDLAGNSLAAPGSWSFTTIERAQEPSTDVTEEADGSTTDDTRGGEVARKQRDATLEIDKMKGTKFPPGEASSGENSSSNPPVVFDGKSHKLKEIFAKAGISLHITLNDKEITPIGDDDYNKADLTSLMVQYSNRKKTSHLGKMYAYLIIVNGFAMTPSGDTGLLKRNTNIVGLMWDNEKRLGTAVFYRHKIINTDPIAYLRTCAHEIGHQFNLHHKDASCTINGSQKKFSIMNQTDVIKLYGGSWPNGVSLEFGPLESQHLSQHDIQYVAPGTSRFDGKCVADHARWHEEAPKRLGVYTGHLPAYDVATSNEVDFQIQMGKEEYLPGQPSIAYLKLTNISSEPLSLIDKLSPEYNVVKFYIKKEEDEVRFMPYVFYEFISEKTILNPDESISGRAKIFYGSNGYTFPQPAVYKVRAEYHGLSDGLGKIIDSNTVDITIRQPRNKEEEEQVKLIMGKEQALFFLFEGGDHFTDGIEQLTKLVQRYPKSVLGSYASAVLGLHWSREFKDFKNNRVRKPNYEKARSFLEIASDIVNGYWANATFLNLAEIHRKAGDKTTMKNIINKYINKFEKESKNTNGITAAKTLLDGER